MDLEAFQQNHPTQTEEVVVRNRRYRLLLPKTLDSFIDPDDPMRDFPLWAKIWEASLVLADALAGMPPAPSRQILEIGCGAGLVGIVAASFGHRVTMTEYNPDALAFAQANAELNLSDSSGKLKIQRLDWHRPDLEGPFDLIIGSEVVYSERDFEPLERLFKTFLGPGGEVILAEGMRRTSMAFLQRLSESWQIEARRMTLRSQEKSMPVILARLQRKANGL